MLLKYAYNDMRSRKEDCSFFDEEILEYLMDINNNVPKDNITVMCGLAVNVSPVPDSMFGNMKLRWCKSPFCILIVQLDILITIQEKYF